jgi:hypothetical protein
MPPKSRAFFTIVACTAGMLTAESNFLCTQAAMQNVSGQTRPQTPPKGLFFMIWAAERFRSEAPNTMAAMMKSAAEQSAGHLSMQGFSAQNSHLANSAFNWASVRYRLFFKGVTFFILPSVCCPLQH